MEESSLWWLGLDIWKHPGNVLLISSIPFCAGAYFGYKKPSEKLQKLAGADGSNDQSNLILVSRIFGEKLNDGNPSVVAESARSECEPPALRNQRSDDSRVAVALIDGGVGASITRFV